MQPSTLQQRHLDRNPGTAAAAEPLVRVEDVCVRQPAVRPQVAKHVRSRRVLREQKVKDALGGAPQCLVARVVVQQPKRLQLVALVGNRVVLEEVTAREQVKKAEKPI